MTILHARGMRAGVRETWTPYRDETFVNPFSRLCQAAVCIPQIIPSRSPLDLARATVARCRCSVRPGDNPGRPAAAAAGGGGAGRGRERPVAACSKAAIASSQFPVGQVVQRLPCVARCVAARPSHQHVGQAVTHLEPEQPRHFVLRPVIRARDGRGRPAVAHTFAVMRAIR
jgi:hypothetical protein